MTVTFLDIGNYGRLGNSMFQIAAAVGHALDNNVPYVFPEWQYRGDFHISPRCFKNKNQIKVLHYYEEPHFHYSEIPYFPFMSIRGYFQSDRYWRKFGDKIRKIFRPNRKVEKLDEVTSIHVRRGDYLIHKGCYTILDMGYYGPAMEICDTDKYLVFSDDIGWCKQFFKGNKFEFSEEKDPVTDLHKMANCINNIIANSSFSWWAAYLNENQDKKVIAPARWFGPKLAPTHNTKDLIPDSWIKL